LTALLNEALNPLAEVPDDVAGQMVPVGRGHHLTVERAGLDEVIVVLVRLIRSARELGALDKPAGIGVALRRPGVGGNSD
jgi:hypothetical protein